jgi:hypothetical protein
LQQYRFAAVLRRRVFVEVLLFSYPIRRNAFLSSCQQVN